MYLSGAGTNMAGLKSNLMGGASGRVATNTNKDSDMSIQHVDVNANDGGKQVNYYDQSSDS